MTCPTRPARALHAGDTLVAAMPHPAIAINPWEDRDALLFHVIRNGSNSRDSRDATHRYLGLKLRSWAP